jgi:hypothetical protein
MIFFAGKLAGEVLRPYVAPMAIWSEPPENDRTRDAGLRFGDKGTHTSRTMMLSEISDLLGAVPADADRDAYVTAVIEDNVLGKQTSATRRLTMQRLAELYGLDPKLPIFRVLRKLWVLDEPGRPLLALLCALARDPLLRATAPAVLGLPEGSGLIRATFLDAIREVVGARLNEAVLDKVARNAASSWSQAGHLEGRVRKIRRRVKPSPGPVAAALWLGSLDKLAGEQLLTTRWTRVLDRTGQGLMDTVLEAKQLGVINARAGGGVTEIDVRWLERQTMER